MMSQFSRSFAVVAVLAVLAVLVAILVASSSRLAASDSWPEFRGPTADGHSTAIGLADTWSETESVRWKVALHDKGWSTPAVLDGKVWMTTATEDGHDLYVVAVDAASGKIVHDERLFHVESPRPLGNTLNSYATPSPVIEGDRVWVSFGSYGTACLDTRTHAVLWRQTELPCNHYRGPASSPLLFRDVVILHMDGSDHQYIVALDKTTGEVRWKTPRSTDYGDLDEDGVPMREGDLRKAYSTPIVVEHAGAPLLISPAAKAAYGYDPASGKELWQVCYDEHSTASRALFANGIAYINTGYAQAQLWAVRAGGQGDVSASHVVWKRSRNVCNRSSPVLIDGLLYYVTDKGIATCLDAASGDEIWVERVGGNYSASLLYADGKIWAFSMEGKATALRPGRSFEILATNELDDGFMASPAVAGKAFYLRTRTHLYRIER